MKFGIHTVFIPRENILFLEEWIVYHMSIGAEAFYLYDNTGSTAKDGDTMHLNNNIAKNGKNRFGIDIAKLTAKLSDIEIMEKMVSLAHWYPVHFIRWANKDSAGNILYDQYKSCANCVSFAETDWLAFIDIDEFIVIDRSKQTPRKIQELIGGWEAEGITKVTINQVKFKDRFVHYAETGENSIKNITESMQVDTTDWGQKCILSRAHFFNDPKARNFFIHILDVTSGKKIVSSIHEIGFNHYNLNPAQLKWIESDPGISKRERKMVQDTVVSRRFLTSFLPFVSSGVLKNSSLFHDIHPVQRVASEEAQSASASKD